MQSKANIFTTIQTEGMILPTDLLKRIATGASDLDGLRSTDYHLAEGEKLNEAISRSWNRLHGLWEIFSKAIADVPAGDLGIGITRSRWLLPLFQELGYGTLQRSKATLIEGKEYPISHFHHPAAIHLIGFKIDLDKRTPGAAGAARTSPHGLMQEFLNRSEPHLWGFLSNGYRLRILRDNISLTRQAYVEFDLKSMMEGEVYSDFVLLWMLCHQSRIETEEGKSPDLCWLEKWSKTAQEQGTRALEDLRGGVENAITALGCGFLAHRSNTTLRQKLQAGKLDKQDYYRYLLRIVYRLIFLFSAEDRDLLLLPDADEQAKNLYTNYYSTQRLRKLSQQTRGTKHCDLYQSLCLVFNRLRAAGCGELGLPALGSFLWDDQAIGDLISCCISNHDLLDAIRALAFTEKNRNLIPVDFKNLGSEELGSIYESLLELHPDISANAGTFKLKTASGHERKTTGSYYTPTSLINCLLDSALDPVVKEALKKPDSEKAILDLKVCDPACGSGHFLVAAAHRIAKHLASVRTGDEEPSPEAQRTALRDVISHCIYGVDINRMSVELCKISLWLEAIEPGKPLSFLDHHIRCGNSLLGTTPALIDRGLPDEAFKPITGDDKDFCTAWKRENKKDRTQGGTLFDAEGQAWSYWPRFEQEMVELDKLDDSTLDGIQKKQIAYDEYLGSMSYQAGKLLCDAWCAAFVWNKEESREIPYPVTQQMITKIQRDPNQCAAWMLNEISRLADHYKFFHWHLAFPDVFKPECDENIKKDDNLGLIGGFDCVLGNPPWERIKIQEKEWFAGRNKAISNARTSAIRQKLISDLEKEDSHLYIEFLRDKRKAEGQSVLVRESGRFPLCGRGDINTYSIFAELSWQLLSLKGRVGCIVPTGIATDDTTKYFFQRIVSTKSLVSLFNFENEKLVFPGVHHAMKFSLMTLTGSNESINAIDFVFFAQQASDLDDPLRHFTLNETQITKMNPSTRTCPVFRSAMDANIVSHIYDRVPVFVADDNGNSPTWDVTFGTLFHMSNDSHLFVSPDECNKKTDYSFLYEAKMFHQFDHRFGSYEGQTVAQANQGKLPELSESEHLDPNLQILPRYLVPQKEIDKRLNGKWHQQWLIAWRDICRNVDSRTTIASILPYCGTGGSNLIFTTEFVKIAPLLVANLNSHILDYVTRQKVLGTHLNFMPMRQLPIISPREYENVLQWNPEITAFQWILSRIIELTYTSWDLEVYARDCGYEGAPFKWEEERRLLLRYELDAAFFIFYLGSLSEWQTDQHLLEHFSTPRDAVSYIMETFPIVKRKDIQQYGSYRSKEMVLEIFDKMTEAIQTGQSYQTVLDPPPGPPCDEQGNFIPVDQWDVNNWPEHIHKPKESELPDTIRPAAQLIEKGHTVLNVLALLYAWEGKRIDRLALEMGLVLMQHENLRQRVITNGVVGSGSDKETKCPRVQYMDNFLAEFNGTQFKLNTTQFIQTIELGPKAESLDNIISRELGAKSIKDAKEVVEAMNIIQEGDQKDLEESILAAGVENVAELIIQGYAA